METDRNYRRYLSENKILFNLTDRVNRVLLKLSEKIVNLDYVPQLDELLAFCQVLSPIQCNIAFIIKINCRQLHWWNSTLLLVSHWGRTVDPEDYEEIIKGKVSLNQCYVTWDESILMILIWICPMNYATFFCYYLRQNIQKYFCQVFFGCSDATSTFLFCTGWAITPTKTPATVEWGLLFIGLGSSRGYFSVLAPFGLGIMSCNSRRH